MTATLLLDNIDKVKEFVAISRTRPYDVDLLSGKYIINGKSIMGIFGLDLTKPVTVSIAVDDTTFINEVSKFFYIEK